MDSEAVKRAFHFSFSTLVEETRDHEYALMTPTDKTMESEWLVFDDDSDAESLAYDHTRDYVEESPANCLSENQLSSYVYMSDTDRRLIAQDEAENYYEGMRSSDITEEYEESPCRR